MSFEAVFRRFFTDWQQFIQMGAGSLLINFAAGAVGGVLGLILLGPSRLAMVQRGGMMGVGSMGAFIGGIIGFVVVAAVVGILGFGLSTAGMVGSVAGYRRGEPVSLGAFWNHASRNVTKIILLGVIFFGIMLISAVINIIPFLGQLVYFAWIAMAAVPLFIYPAHLIVNEGRGVTDAVGLGFTLITKHFMEALITGGIMLVFGIVFGILGQFVPFVGGLVVVLVGHPLVTYFFVERFEAEVRPKLLL